MYPRLLIIGSWQLLHPRVALTAWFGSFALVFGLALAGLSFGVVAAESAVHNIPHARDTMIVAAAWVSAGILVALFSFFCTFSGSFQSLRPNRNPSTGAMAYVKQEHIGFTLVRFQSDFPEAYAVPGRRREIFISSAIENALTKPQLQAVLAHEFAHLQHHHVLAMRISQISSLCLPGALSGAALERAARLQIELAADDAAARQVGAAHLANALIALSEQAQDVAMLLRAERLTRKRWPTAHQRRLPRGMLVASFVN